VLVISSLAQRVHPQRVTYFIE